MTHRRGKEWDGDTEQNTPNTVPDDARQVWGTPGGEQDPDAQHCGLKSMLTDVGVCIECVCGCAEKREQAETT